MDQYSDIPEEFRDLLTVEDNPEYLMDLEEEDLDLQQFLGKEER